MPYTLTRHANFQVEVNGHLDSEAVDVERRQIVHDIRRRASVPGFRPGRAPETVVRSRFAAEIATELEQQLAERLWAEVVEAETDLELLTRPQIKHAHLHDDGSFHLEAALEVRPRYELPEIEGVDLPEVPTVPTDEEVAEEIERIRTENGAWEPVEDDEASDGMLVEADLVGEMEGSEEEPYREENARFVMGGDDVPPEINEALQGARPGDERVAEKRFPDDDPKPERAGKKVRYRIGVKGLRRRQLPPVDDDLAKAVGLDSLDDLRERVREGLVRRKRADRREQQRRAVLDHLEAGIDPADLPSSLVQSAVQEDLNRFAYSMAMQGMAPDSDQVDWQAMAARFEPGSRRKVLDTLILEQLAETWDIGVPENEVDAYVTAEAQQLGHPPAEHKATLASDGKLDQVRHAARVSATVDEMIRRAGGEVE